MKTGFPVFLSCLIALGLSWCGFVLAPVLQLGTEKQTEVLNSSDIYPNQRPGDATLGLQVYRKDGCAACHTTQVQQSGFACNVILTSTGKNPAAVSNLISTLKLTGITKDEADSISSQITAAGGKSETHIFATGADISRGWGVRRSVAEDFLWDNPVQLGGIRVGPDLANVGARLPDARWQLRHLYSPQSVVKNSAMPPFRFLFEKKNGAVIPTDDAKNLVAYLLSLRAEVPLHDAPFTPPSISTNAPAEKK